MVGRVRFGDRGRSSRIDPRRRIEGGDIFDRAALRDAVTSVERGDRLSALTKRQLGVDDSNLSGFRSSIADRLERSGRNVGGPFDPRNITEQRRGLTTDALGRSLFDLGNDADNRLRAGVLGFNLDRRRQRSILEKRGLLGDGRRDIFDRVFKLDKR